MGKRIVFNDWFSGDDRQEKAVWAFDYLKKRLPEGIQMSTLWPNDPANTVADLINIKLYRPHLEGERNTLLEKMFNTWRKRVGRKKAQKAGLVALGFMVSMSAKRKLRTHAKRLNIKEAEALELLLLNTKDFAERRYQAEIKTLKKEIQELKAGERVSNRGKRDTALFFETRELGAAINEIKKVTAEFGEVLEAAKSKHIGQVVISDVDAQSAVLAVSDVENSEPQVQQGSNALRALTSNDGAEDLEDKEQSDSAGGTGVQPHADKITFDSEKLANGDLVLPNPSFVGDTQVKKKRKKKNKKQQQFTNTAELAESRNLDADLKESTEGASDRLLNPSLQLEEYASRKEVIRSNPMEQASAIHVTEVSAAKSELTKLVNSNDKPLPELILLMSLDGTWKGICKFKEDRKKGHRVDNQALSQLIRHWADLRVSESPQTGRSYYLESAIDNFFRD